MNSQQGAQPASNENTSNAPNSTPANRGNRTAPRKRNRRRKAAQQTGVAESNGTGENGRKSSPGEDKLETPAPGSNGTNAQATQSRNGRRRNRGKKGNKANDTQGEEGAPNSGNSGTSNETANSAQPQQDGKKKKKRKPRKKKHPWRRVVPQGSVDPITLEDIVSLNYPPFALAAEEPYDAVPIWPVPKEQKDNSQPQSKTVDIEKLNRDRIAEQWGTPFEENNEEEKSEQKPDAPAGERHFNLYDGRALAYYIVSQLQFIDPLNRRDLTRAELVSLDEYLVRNGFKDLKVTDAYDAKGVTLSSAGAAAATAQGRADILQQMASNLLTSLFRGGPGASMPSRGASSSPQERSLRDQYAALQVQEQQTARRSEQRIPSLNPNAIPYDVNGASISDHGGLTIIDDDENPALRGADANTVRNSLFYSANHIATRYGGDGSTATTADAFPALPTPGQVPTPVESEKAVPNNSKPAGKPSKTLARIAGAVRKTDPEEQQRQWEAREAARKRAMMANLSFGVEASLMQTTQQAQPIPTSYPIAPSVDLPEEKLQRNRAFAEALGVKPATMRQQMNSGWARPTGPSIGLSEFGNELSAASYPDELVAQARERMGLLLKLEKRWTAFLKDDKAASLPLNSMDRPTRTFVHHYSDFWNLKTESFDPEPKRYVHCVKTLDTHMPQPLLSEEARNRRGPLSLSVSDKSQQAAGEPSKSRDIPPPPDRTPLTLLPRSLPLGEQKADPVSNETERMRDTEASNPNRFGGLFDGRERPKLELAKRTVPLELPPFEPEKPFDLAADLQARKVKKEEQTRKEREAAEQKRKLLEDAFASDDESNNGSSGSEWEEPVALYQGGDDEE